MSSVRIQADEFSKLIRLNPYRIVVILRGYLGVLFRCQYTGVLSVKTLLFFTWLKGDERQV